MAGKGTASVIDTRNFYKAKPIKGDENMWKLYFRRWYSPVWHYFDCAYGLDRARAKAVSHAAVDDRVTVHLGRFPE